MYIYNFNQFLNETDESHKFGCVMAYFDTNKWDSLIHIIDQKDLANGDKSLELEPHVTILYGLHNNINHSKVLETIRSFPNVSVFLNNISLFENDVDVVKFDIKNDMLASLNNELLEFPNSNKYPIYKPHTTIAYCKKGTGQKYVGNILPIKLTSTYYIYSLADGTKYKIDI